MLGGDSDRFPCWENAVVEGVFRSLQHEWIGEQRYLDHPDAQRDVTDFIARNYSRIRQVHS